MRQRRCDKCGQFLSCSTASSSSSSSSSASTSDSASDSGAVVAAAASAADAAAWSSSDSAAGASASTQELLQALHKQQAEWQQTLQQMKANAAKVKQIVTLNIGGKLFATTKATLLRLEGTYFHAMLSSGVWQPDQNGAYFIDVDPENFDRIVMFLRTGERDVSDLSERQLKRLHRLADYLQVPLFVTDNTAAPSITARDRVVWDANYCSGLEVSEQGTVVTKKRSNDTSSSSSNSSSGHEHMYTAVRGSMACDCFSIRLDAEGDHSGFLVGFISKAAFRANRSNFAGYWYNASVGEIRISPRLALWQYRRPANCHGQMKATSILTARYDSHRKAISFELDGLSLGVVHQEMDGSTELYPFVEIYDQGVQLTLVASDQS